MSVDTYKGESPSKKMARLGYWRAVRKFLGGRFTKTKHVVLASREGGDIGVLVGLGVPKENIIAVDQVESAAQACAQKWPGVEVIFGDVADVVEARAKEVGSVFLDFCGPISTTTVQVGRKILRALRYDSIFGIALLKGREHGEIEINDEGRMSRRARRAANAMRRRGGEGAAEANMMTWSTVGKVATREILDGASDESHLGGYSRAKAFLAALHAAKHDQWSGVTRAHFIIDYQSVTKESRGVPMTIALCLKERHTAEAYQRHKHEYGYAPMRKFTDEMVRAFAVSPSAGPTPHLLLNIDRATIAAWKAHATRGTYDGEWKWDCQCPCCVSTVSDGQAT